MDLEKSRSSHCADARGAVISSGTFETFGKEEHASMRRSFFKKLSIALLALLLIGWAGFVYASPSEWQEVTGIFIALTGIYAIRVWAATRAADRGDSGLSGFLTLTAEVDR